MQQQPRGQAGPGASAEIRRTSERSTGEAMPASSAASASASRPASPSLSSRAAPADSSASACSPSPKSACGAVPLHSWWPHCVLRTELQGSPVG